MKKMMEETSFNGLNTGKSLAEDFDKIMSKNNENMSPFFKKS